MDTERELQELAAKAAAYDVTWNDRWRCFVLAEADDRRRTAQKWQPFMDDGDALRLAVDLGCSISISWNGTHVICRGVTEPIGKDKMTAVRRAIVLAAAKIGGGES